MAGDETHGYDLVIEFAEHAIQDLLQTIFDNGLLAAILDALPGVGSDAADVFTIDVRFDRPTDVSIPASAADTVDISVLLGDSGNGGSMRIVVGVDVDHSGDNDDIGLNFASKLYYSDVEVLIAGHSLPGLNTPFRHFLQNQGRLDLVPVPVDRTSTSTTALVAADARVIDDTSPADLDAFAALLTLGGGSAGTKSAFTRSFISPGGNAGIAVGFPWLCRTISPMIDSGLNLGGAFTNCNLTRTVRIDNDQEVDLTALSIAPDDGFIHVSATVHKSGFCYDATGTVGAKILMEIQNGQLLVSFTVDDPDVDVSIPWYCWLAAAVVGAIVGGLLLGVIGAIVGGILLPLVLWLSTDGVEGIVQAAAQKIADTINSLSPTVNVPAVGINLVFSDVFIDDIAIGGRLQVTDNAPVRAEGTVVVPNGMCVDLDSGKIGTPDRLPSVDLMWEGSGFGRDLHAVCGARLARTDLGSFDEVTRASLYRGPYAAPNPIPLAELATWFPFGGLSQLFGIDAYQVSLRIYGVRTNEGRFAAVSAIEVTDDYVRLRYRTYEKRMPTLAIVGGFSCTHGPVPDRGVTTFVPSPALTKVAAATAATPRPRPAMRALAALRPIDPRQAAVDTIPLAQRRLGWWYGTSTGRTGPGKFTASAHGFGSGLEIRWRVNDEPLTRASGSVTAAGVTLRYQIDGRTVTLTTRATQPFEFLLAAVAFDDDGNSLEAERCVRFEPTCTGEVRVFPAWTEFREAYLANFGIAEVATTASATAVVSRSDVSASRSEAGRRTSR